MTVAVFQKGKEFVWEGIELVMKVVDEAEVAAHLAEGWFAHPYDTIKEVQEAITGKGKKAAPVVESAPDAAPSSTEPVAPNPFAKKGS